MPQSYTCLNYHLVFSTKDRRSLITADLQPRLYAYLGGILREEKGALFAAGGTADHVHLLAGIHKQQAVATALRIVKANSSKWMHEEFPELSEFAWQAGYAAFSVSASAIDKVKAYIANQEEHHRRTTFKEELVTLLERHGVSYDEQYLWE